MLQVLRLLCDVLAFLPGKCSEEFAVVFLLSANESLAHMMRNIFPSPSVTSLWLHKLHFALLKKNLLTFLQKILLNDRPCSAEATAAGLTEDKPLLYTLTKFYFLPYSFLRVHPQLSVPSPIPHLSLFCAEVSK